MVIVMPSRTEQALYAVATVAAVAIMVVIGAPLLFERMASSSWPDWVLWATAGFVMLGALPLYWAMLPVGSAQVLRGQAK